MQNNRTYHFRARARDNAGNIGSWSSSVSISVDLNPPSCDVADLPMYTTNTIFTVSWSGSDGESGVLNYDVQAMAAAAGCGIPTGWNILDGLDDTSLTSYTGAYQDGCQYFFRCRSADVAGNIGPWSAAKNTTVDTTDPVSSVNPLPEWLNVTSFAVSWSGTGLVCFGIQWSNDSISWSDWFNCTTSTSSVFGPGSPATVQDGVTYYFRSRGTDSAGHIEAWPVQPDAYTTIDLTPPAYTLRAEDGYGNGITGYTPNLDKILIKSNATDSTSGIAHHYIEYVLVMDEGNEIANLTDCGPAPPYGGLSECEASVDFTGAMMIEFRVIVVDRAGNKNSSSTINIGTHALANFARHRLSLTLGESGLLKIYVRNVQAGSDNVTIVLTSTLPIVPYFIGLGSLMLMNGTWVGDDVDLADNNRTITVKNLLPGEIRRYDSLVWSVEPQLDVYQVFLNASSGLSQNLTDYDEALVRIGYPASFPGLNEWAIAMLIALAVVSYSVLDRKSTSRN
jgi:hypothetical protein